jgi:hypothetical protein
MSDQDILLAWADGVFIGALAGSFLGWIVSEFLWEILTAAKRIFRRRGPAQ